jgi:hypothetical protein
MLFEELAIGIIKIFRRGGKKAMDTCYDIRRIRQFGESFDLYLL